MKIPVCIQNDILVELSKTFQDEMSTASGFKIFKNTTFRPEWNATITGTVASVPKKLTIGNGKSQSFSPDRPKIKQIVKPGDEIIFSYLVVMNRGLTDNVGEIFERESPKTPYITIWATPNGLKLVRVYLNNNKFEVGLLDTKTRVWVDRVIGGERDVENFMAKYMPTENASFNYCNLIPYEDHDYWKVDYLNAIAIKRGDGVFDMIGDYVLIEPIHEPMRVTHEGVIEIHEIEQSKDYKAIGKLISIGLPLEGQPTLGVKTNDIICTDIRYAEKYEIDGKDYWVVRQKYIYGKTVQNEYQRNP